MSNASEFSGSFGTERDLVPPGTSLLLAVTIIMVALACALGAYLLATQALQQLHAQGYKFWSDVTFSSPLIPDPAYFGGSAWVLYQPGWHPGIAFATRPIVRAVVAFICIAGGGLTILVAARHFQTAAKHPGLVLGLIAVGFGLQATLQGAPAAIDIDLPSHQLTSGDTSLPLGSIRGFTTFTHHGRHNHGTDLYVEAGSNSAELAKFTLSTDAVAMQAALQDFTSSNGGQL
jgi:hypothetical protein